MKKYIIILTLVISVCTITELNAGNPTKRGTAGAQELLLSVGGRGTALSGAAVSLSSGLDAIHWNPAGLAGGFTNSNVEALFSKTDYIEDVGINYAGLGINVSEFGILAFTLKSLSFGDIDVTTEDFPDGTGDTYSPSLITLTASYSNQLTDRISIGVTTKYISESIQRTTATGFAVDAGVIYKVSSGGRLDGLRFGVVLKNIGPNMQFNGADLEEMKIPNASDPAAQPMPFRYISQSFELPSTFDMGVSYDYSVAPDITVTPMVSFQNVNFGDDQFKLAAELNYSNFIFARGGYNMPANETTETINVNGPSFGFGINYGMGSSVLGLDYSYSSIAVFDIPNHTVALKVTF